MPLWDQLFGTFRRGPSPARVGVFSPASYPGELELAEIAFAGEKHHDVTAAVRWAECAAIRVWMTGNPAFAPEFFTRMAEVKQNMRTRIHGREAQLLPALVKVPPKSKTLLERLLHMNASPHVLRSVDFVTLGEQEQSQRIALREWQREQGLLALCEVLTASVYISLNDSPRRAASQMCSAWSRATKALGPSEQLDECEDLLHFVKAILPIMHDASSPKVAWYIRAVLYTQSRGRDSLSARCREEAEQSLLRLARSSNVTSEARQFSVLALVASSVLVSEQEYRADRATYLKRAAELLDEVFLKTPDYALLKWARSHVHRRLGRVEQGTAELFALTKVIQGQTRRVSNRLMYELACMAFARGAWTECMGFLDQAVDDRSGRFQGMMLTMGSACIAIGEENQVKAVHWLNLLEGMLEWKGEKGQMSRTDEAWLRKLDVLYFRPHKRVLAYELTYILGFYKWFDSDVGGLVRVGGRGEVAKWLARCSHDLNELYAEATVSAVYPDKLTATHEDALEELLVVSLMCGSIAAMKGNLDQAEIHFQHVLENAGTITAKRGTKKNPWHAPFAHYELGSMEIRRGHLQAADRHLVRAQRLCVWRNFSHYQDLLFRCAQARRYIADQPLPVDATAWRKRGDELGQWLDGAPESPSGRQEGAAVIPVPRGETYVIRHIMHPRDMVAWTWSVESGDIGFRVEYDAKERKKERHISFEDDLLAVSAPAETENLVSAAARYEAGDVVSSFYVASEIGILKLIWDNEHARHTDKQINYLARVTRSPDV